MLLHHILIGGGVASALLHFKPFSQIFVFITHTVYSLMGTMVTNCFSSAIAVLLVPLRGFLAFFILGGGWSG